MIKNDFFSFFQEGYQNVPNFSTNVNKTVFLKSFQKNTIFWHFYVKNGPKWSKKWVFQFFSKKNIKMFQIFLRIWIHLVFSKKMKKNEILPFYVINGPDPSQNLIFLFFLKKICQKTQVLTFLCPKNMYATHDQKKARPPRGWMQLMVTFNIKNTITCRVRLVEAPPFWGSAFCMQLIVKKRRDLQDGGCNSLWPLILKTP